MSKEGNKKLSLQERYNRLFQKLNDFQNADRPEQERTHLTGEKLDAKRADVKKLATAIKRDIIDSDYGAGKNWGDIRAADKEFYSLLLEYKSKQKGIDIYLCKNMWCAMNTFGEVFKAENFTTRRREKANEAVSGSEQVWRILLSFIYGT